MGEITEVYMVCVAYESGVGTGHKSVKNENYHRDMNPYKPDSKEHEAWYAGFDFGVELSK